MKKILLLVMTRYSVPSQRVPDWPNLLRERVGPDADVQASGLPDLTFVIKDGDAQVFDPVKGYDVAGFDLVVFRTVGKYLEEAIAVAAYCRRKGVPYIDQYIPHIGNAKLGCAFVRWEHGIRVPNTLYGPISSIINVATKGSLGWPLVVKDNSGRKGRNNFLAHDVTELKTILERQPDVVFIVQSFIPNDGDYRLLVLNGQIRVVILRKAAIGSHLNNTSQGGVAEEVPVGALRNEVRELALKAATLDRLIVAGVDIVIDKHDGLPYILEVNRAPQLASGAVREKKVKVYAQTLRELLGKS